MPRVAALLVLAVAACSLWDGDEPAASAIDMQGWRFTSGKRPSRAEYTAVVAACEQGALARTQGKPLELCLTDLGLRRE
jgi:hypothetical protein